LGPLVIGKLRSYGATKTQLRLSVCHEQGLRKNNRAENSHLPVRRREAEDAAIQIARAPSGFCAFTPQFRTCSMSNAILFPATRSAPHEAKPCRIGGQRRRLEFKSISADFPSAKPGSRAIPFELRLTARHDQGLPRNNRAENSHLPVG
jgi:hypothetical protein